MCYLQYFVQACLWTAHYDESSGNTYYYNSSTNDTTWERWVDDAY
jgi:hypothetical protein